MRKCLWVFIAVFCIITPAMAVDQVEMDVGFFQYKDGGRRDPFWPLVTENGAIISYDEQDLVVSDMILQGIMLGNEENIAIINGKIVKVGDIIGTFKIEEVAATFVILDNGKEKVELRLKKEE